MQYELIEQDRERIHFIRFDDLTELIDESIGANLARHDADGNVRFPEDQYCQNEAWCGREFGTWENFKQVARENWAEGLEVFEQMREKVARIPLDTPVTVRRAPAFRDDDGDEICLDRLKSNRPFWRTTQRAKRTGKRTVTIVADVTTSASVDWKDVMWRGVAAVVLADRLEQAGYGVELLAVEYCTRSPFSGSSRANMLGCCRLKAVNDPLDVSTLVNAVSGWFYRTAWFCAYCLAPGEWPESGLGYPTSVKPHLSRITPDEHALLAHGFMSFESAYTWLRDNLRQFTAEQSLASA